VKLYFSQGACSLSPHIVLREAGLPFELVRVHLGSKKTADGEDFRAINPKGYVPTLGLDDGQILTEGPAIVQYIADLAPQSRLAPPAGSVERVRLQEWLNYISTEIHKSFSPLFSPKAPAEWKQVMREVLASRFDFVASSLGDKPFLMGEQFTAADAYLYTTLRWCRLVELDLGKWPTLQQYLQRVADRPSVKAAMDAERPHGAA
jgi:glutathione S-transferase